MKVWLVALNTFRGLLRHRALLAFLLFFLIAFVGSLAGMYFAQRVGEAGGAEQSRMIFTAQIDGVIQFYGVYAYMLALLSGAFLLPGEIKSGTLLPTLGRALSRAQFLLGLFIGLNLLLVSYLLLATAAVGVLCAWAGLVPSTHMLVGVAYLVLRANIYAALTFFLSTRVAPLLSIVVTLIYLNLDGMTEGLQMLPYRWVEYVQRGIEYLLPAWPLLPANQYLQLTQAPTGQGWEFFFIGIAHAIDYMAIFLLLAVVAFRRRSLLPPN